MPTIQTHESLKDLGMFGLQVISQKRLFRLAREVAVSAVYQRIYLPANALAQCISTELAVRDLARVTRTLVVLEAVHGVESFRAVGTQQCRRRIKAAVCFTEVMSRDSVSTVALATASAAKF